MAATYQYDPFGNLLATTGTSAAVDANPFRFSTKYFDGETGLYDYGYRYYSPQIGRWMTRDPMQEGGGVNVYAFVGNDPINFFDADGRDRIKMIWDSNENIFKVFRYKTVYHSTGTDQIDGTGVIIEEKIIDQLGHIDNETGNIAMWGEYATPKSVQEEAARNGAFDADWRQAHLFGRTYEETIAHGHNGVIAREQFFAEEGDFILKSTAGRDGLQARIDEISQSVGLAKDLVSQLQWFYALAPLDLAQTIKVSSSLKYADKVTLGNGILNGDVSLGRLFRALKLSKTLEEARATPETIRMLEAMAQAKNIKIVHSPSIEALTRVEGKAVSVVFNKTNLREVPLVHLLDEFGHAERIVAGEYTIGPAANTARNWQHHMKMFGEWSIDPRLSAAEQEIAQEAELFIKRALKELE